jgi:hypothetical protein
MLVVRMWLTEGIRAIKTVHTPITNSDQLMITIVEGCPPGSRELVGSDPTKLADLTYSPQFLPHHNAQWILPLQFRRQCVEELRSAWSGALHNLPAAHADSLAEMGNGIVAGAARWSLRA